LFLFIPLALLSWGPAHLVWLVLIACGIILAILLTWNLASNYSLLISVVLLSIVALNSQVLLGSGNVAGMAVSLCVVAVWCFLSDRFIPAGVLCLAVSLALKPHDAWLVWLYFLLIGGANRRRALLALVIVIVLAVPAILWVTDVSPHWIQEFHSNLVAESARGQLNDPGPFSPRMNILGLIIDLQTVISIFGDDPRIYNAGSFVISGAFLCGWLVALFRSRSSPRKQLLLLAAIAAFSMLPVYHRETDAKLLLLTIPACAMLWAEGKLIRWVCLGLNAAALILTADLPTALFYTFTDKLSLSTSTLAGRIETALLERPIPLVLLLLAGFYLWASLRGEAKDRTPLSNRTSDITTYTNQLPV
jgi:hypothetical protein